MNPKRVVRPGLAALVLALAGCAGNLPNLRWQYLQTDPAPVQERQQKARPHPVIVIPGLMSSRLRDADTGREAWFGPWWRIYWHDYRDLALEIDPQTLDPRPSALEASSLPRTVLGNDFYGSLFDVLEDGGGYEYTEPGTPYTGRERRYYRFPYDWRYGNVRSARRLDALIEQIRRDYDDPDLKVDIVAHSMGGLVARYYMRYGTTDVLDDNAFPVNLDGATKVRRLVLLGTPNLGSVLTTHRLMEGYKMMFNRIPAETIVTMPSVYQLLPHPLVDWLVTTDGEPLERDLFDVRIWRRFEWGIFDPDVITRIKERADSPQAGRERVELLQSYFEKHLERARRFVWSLTVEIPDNAYEIIVFGGNCQATPSRLVVEEVDGVSHVRLEPDQIHKPAPDIDYTRLMYAPGDGTVTKPSVLARDFLDPTIKRHKYNHFPLDYAFFLCTPHGQLTSNISFQDNLLNALLSW